MYTILMCMKPTYLHDASNHSMLSDWETPTLYENNYAYLYISFFSYTLAGFDLTTHVLAVMMSLCVGLHTYLFIYFGWILTLNTA
jgi:hypothetical protein